MAHTIVIDGKGGDPCTVKVIIQAIILAAKKLPEAEIIIAGDKEIIEKKYRLPKNINIIDAPGEIRMTDPIEYLRNQKGSSLVVAAKAAKEKNGALVGFGNTGATMSAAVIFMERIKGIDRAALAVVLPTITKNKKVLLLDVGAWADSSQENLVQFAKMGNVYVRKIFGIKDPVIGLLGIGEEPEKGNVFYKEVNGLLFLQKDLNFNGNVEGRDLFSGYYDVIVCDGFSGNIAIKLVEGVFNLLSGIIKNNPLLWPLVFLALPLAIALKPKIDRNEYGGVQLLGVDGTCIIGHGKSNKKAIIKAIELAYACLENKIVMNIKEGITSDKKISPTSKKLFDTEDTANL